MIAKNLGDDLLKAGTARKGLPFRQNSSNTFCRGLLKLEKIVNNIYYKTNIYFKHRRKQRKTVLPLRIYVRR